MLSSDLSDKWCVPSRVYQTAVYIWNSTSETPYDVVMKTAEVKLSCHINIDLQSRYLWHSKWTEGEKKTFILLEIQSKKTLLSPRTTKLWRGYRVCPVHMYVSTYVRTFVRSFVCSPALATSFIIQFRYNFTQVLDMTIPRTSSRFSMIGSRSRSQWLFIPPAYEVCHGGIMFSSFLCVCVCVCVCVCLLTIFVSAP